MSTDRHKIDERQIYESHRVEVKAEPVAGEVLHWCFIQQFVGGQGLTDSPDESLEWILWQLEWILLFVVTICLKFLKHLQ